MIAARTDRKGLAGPDEVTVQGGVGQPFRPADGVAPAPTPNTGGTGCTTNEVDLRISHADREKVSQQLCRHFVDGRLTLPEFEDRTSRLYDALTSLDLRTLLSDLPALPERRRLDLVGVGRHLRRALLLRWASLSVGIRLHVFVWMLLSTFWIVLLVTVGVGGRVLTTASIAAVALSIGIHGAIRRAAGRVATLTQRR